MKNFTLKMKSLLFGLLAVLGMATPASAEVTSVADLFGKYTFTADIEYTAAGKEYEGKYKSNCEVRIEKEGGYYDGQIVGLAGMNAEAQKINAWEADSLSILNPNGQGGIWGGLTMSDASGKYPYGVNGYSVKYAYNKADGSFTIPDFTLGICDHPKEAFEVMVKFTNVKLTLVELEKIEVVDLTGDWHFEAGKGKWDTMEGSTLPTVFDMKLVAKDASFKSYDVDFVYGDFAPVKMEAGFNGATFNLKLDSTALDAKECIYMILDNVKFPQNYHSDITFNYTEKGALNLTSSFMIVRNDSIAPNKPKGTMQWFMGGIAKRPGEAVEVSWDGEYNMVASSFEVEDNPFNLSKEFNMVIKYEDYWQSYFVTGLVGLEFNGFSITVDANDPTKAVINAPTSGHRAIKMYKEDETHRHYLILTDENGGDGVINLTLKEDGSIEMGNFMIAHAMMKKSDNSYEPEVEPVALYGKSTGSKKVVVPFSWAQTFNVTADVEVLDTLECPNAFDMVVTYEEASDWYAIRQFFGGDIYNLNYGGGFTVSKTNSNEAQIAAKTILRSLGGGKFLAIADAKGGENPIKITADAEGNLVFDDFKVMVMDDWTSKHLSTEVANYTNVKGKVGVPSAIESVKNESVKVWVSNGSVNLDKAQAIQVYNVSGQCVFNGVTAQVNNLSQGLYIVKTAAGVAKVLVK